MRATDAVIGLGYTGVAFFFVLSGVVLAWSHKAGDTKKSFYWRRFARVWPLHALMTALAVPLILLSGGSTPWEPLPLY
jgi:peptidoglycan/LPS O-acetylase OafA/YrhL